MRTLHDKRTVKYTTPLTTPSSTSPGGLSSTCLGINYTRAERKDNVVSLSVQSGSSELQFEVSHEVFAYGDPPIWPYVGRYFRCNATGPGFTMLHAPEVPKVYMKL